MKTLADQLIDSLLETEIIRHANKRDSYRRKPERARQQRDDEPEDAEDDERGAEDDED